MTATVRDLHDLGPEEPARPEPGTARPGGHTDPAPADGPGIDPARLAVCLAVLAELDGCPVDHPDAIAVRRATAGIYRTVKQRRRQERRAAKTAHDKAVTEATATGAADRIDDETARHPARPPPSSAAIAGMLQRPRSCYICKTRYVEVDAFYHQLCPDCAARRTTPSATPAPTSPGKRALLTGGRAKIGMYIALRLLRDGAHTTITTRFPDDAVRRFKAHARQRRLDAPAAASSASTCATRPRWSALADSVAAAGAAGHPDQQRRADRAPLPGAYAQLVAAEPPPLPAGELPATEVVGAFGHRRAHRRPRCPVAASASALDRAGRSADLALVAGSASLARIAAGTAIDAGGLRARPRTTRTPGCRRSTRSTRWSCSRCSCATHGAVHPGQPAAPGDGRVAARAASTS